MSTPDFDHGPWLIKLKNAAKCCVGMRRMVNITPPNAYRDHHGQLQVDPEWQRAADQLKFGPYGEQAYRAVLQAYRDAQEAFYEAKSPNQGNSLIVITCVPRCLMRAAAKHS